MIKDNAVKNIGKMYYRGILGSKLTKAFYYSPWIFLVSFSRCTGF